MSRSRFFSSSTTAVSTPRMYVSNPPVLPEHLSCHLPHPKESPLRRNHNVSPSLLPVPTYRSPARSLISVRSAQSCGSAATACLLGRSHCQPGAVHQWVLPGLRCSARCKLHITTVVVICPMSPMFDLQTPCLRCCRLEGFCWVLLALEQHSLQLQLQLQGRPTIPPELRARKTRGTETGAAGRWGDLIAGLPFWVTVGAHQRSHRAAPRLPTHFRALHHYPASPHRYAHVGFDCL